jgi:hypothetical protein
MGLKLRLAGLDFTQNKPGHLLIHYPATLLKLADKSGKIHNPVCYQDGGGFVGALQFTTIHPMVSEPGFLVPGYGVFIAEFVVTELKTNELSPFANPNHEIKIVIGKPAAPGLSRGLPNICQFPQHEVRFGLSVTRLTAFSQQP